MPFVHLVVLAVVQGITEFLPISSSGHLVLVPVVMGWPDQGLMVDIAVHVGTLGAVIAYFWRDVGQMLLGLLDVARGRSGSAARLFLQVVLATLPVVVAGLAVEFYLGDAFRSVVVIGWTTLGFGIVLYVADRVGMTVRRIEHMTFGAAVLIGLAQVLALVPGTSRSGITMTAARFLGFERVDSARFSLLLSMPTILAAGTLAGIDLFRSGDLGLRADAALAALLAFISALIAIALMMAWLKRASFGPFVVYRLVLGAALLAYAYGLV
ncbi:MAG: undecaprenyl-diphosphate phosphatase [Proteobacteria bacterium]|nr:undecaprenyl-diphosphate phosphatase [Pseudomonadota bacterium]